ncbi:MAG: HypC/HybG/HupF family hydrogenase formation chaperone [Eubacteriales bacterium]|nr:HypC/HybG/HupF family hydrogenase formation chaperone [Eubacteriales bacterium]
MCLAVPAKLIAVQDKYAYAEIMGTRQKVNSQLIEEPSPGDHVLIHAGFAIEKIDDGHYAFLNETLHEMVKGEENE